MKNRRKLLATLLLVAILVCPGISLNESDADDGDGDYGAYLHLSSVEIDQFLKQIIGMTLEELIEYIFSEAEGYEIDVNNGTFSEMGIERSVQEVDGYHIIHDEISAYLGLFFDVAADGPFPPEGSYKVDENEDLLLFLLRVLEENKGEQRHVDITVSAGFDIQADILSKINLKTGEFESSSITFKFMLDSAVVSDIELEMPEDDVIEIKYRNYEEDTKAFLNLGIDISADGFKVVSSEESWACEPVITEHIRESKVSADFAGTIWDIIKESSNIDDLAKKRLPELLINIITSSNRMMDIFDTLKSLTGISVPDYTLTGECKMTNQTDDAGNSYVDILIKRGEIASNVKMYPGPYMFSMGTIVDILPADIMPDSLRLLINLAILTMGWDKIEVKDISQDAETKEKIDQVEQFVDEDIAYYDKYTEFKMPVGYICAAIVVIAVSVALSLVAWRRS